MYGSAWGTSYRDPPYNVRVADIQDPSSRPRLSFPTVLLLFHSRHRFLQAISRLTEPLLGLRTSILDDLNDTSLQSFNGRNVVGENTHVPGSGGDVDLGDTLGRV